MDNPTKTFGLREPMDLFVKLEFDLGRLKAARYTKEQQFSALDCALSAYHMIEWVLHKVDETNHLRLTGVRKGGQGAVARFINKQSDVLGTLPICEQIALTGKHRVLTRTPDNESLSTGHSIEFDPPFDSKTGTYLGGARAVTYVRDVGTGEEIEAYTLFHAALEQWRRFLQRERLYDWSYGYEPEPDDD